MTSTTARIREHYEDFAADMPLQPWLLPKHVACEVARVIPFGYRKRLRFFFNDFGCIRCRRRTVRYGGSGFCENCSSRVSTLLRLSMKRHQKEIQADTMAPLRPTIQRYIERVDRAEELLADFRPRTKRPNSKKKKSHHLGRRTNSMSVTG